MVELCVEQSKRSWVFKSQGNTHTEKMYSLNALLVALDKSIC